MTVALCAGTADAGDPEIIRQIKETILTIRTGDTVTARTDAAERLALLTREVDSKNIDDGTLADIVSLLDGPDESAYGRVAAALGFLGPRAKS